MIATFVESYTNVLDKKLNNLRKHYKVEVLGFGVNRLAYAMVDVTEMDTWDPDLGEEPYGLPDDPNALTLDGPPALPFD